MIVPMNADALSCCGEHGKIRLCSSNSRRFASKSAAPSDEDSSSVENFDLRDSKADRIDVSIWRASDCRSSMEQASGANAGSVAEQLSARCISAVRRPRSAEASIDGLADGGIRLGSVVAPSNLGTGRSGTSKLDPALP